MRSDGLCDTDCMTRVSHRAFERAIEDLLVLTDQPTNAEQIRFSARTTTLGKPPAPPLPQGRCWLIALAASAAELPERLR
jgi:hypothetical protein